eukprot:bmy_00395T0
MCARRWRSAAPELPFVRIWFACIRFQTFAWKEGETVADRARSELGVFSVFGWFSPWSLTIPHREPCSGTKP